jgi:uncharacterized protein
MAVHYISRTIESVLKRAVREFPAVVLTGPRQAGKTTLLKHLFGKSYNYVSMELPDVRLSASVDPRGFLNMHAPPVIFDEIQYAPDLLLYIKEHIDSMRSKKGLFILTGSQNLLLIRHISESLAGRAAILRLLPLSYHELRGSPNAVLPWEKGTQGHRSIEVPYPGLWKGFIRGGYPELATQPGRDISLWHSSYIQTYLERDIRGLRQIGDLTSFQSFIRALAARCAQLVNLTEMSRELGVAVNTLRAWLSIMEATFQIIILRPYFANIGKRLVKTPKIYFTDTGTLCHLVALKDPEHAAKGPMNGAIFETVVVSEIVKSFIHRGMEPQIYFWRTATGTEVDIVVEIEGRLIPVEVKLSSTPDPSMAYGIHVFKKDFGKKASGGYVVYPGNVRLPLAPDTIALPFSEL